MVAQSDAVTWLNSVVGQHLDFDHQYGQQCVDFFNFYYQFCTGDNPYGDGYSVPSAKDLWNVPNDRFTKIPDSSSLVPQPGDVAIYGAAWGSGNGHVEIVLGTDGNGCTFVGENEHGNPSEGVVKVYRTWAQMRGLVGVMRLVWQVTPVAPTVTITPISGEFTITGNKWNLDLSDFNTIAANPVSAAPTGPVTITAALTRSDLPQYTYYLEDATVHQGYNQADCQPYTPPPTPYVPPAAPVVAKAAEKYELLTSLPAYESVDNLTKNKPSTTLPAGMYYVWEKGGTNGNYYRLSHDNIHEENLWVNTISNKKPLNPPTITLQSAPVDNVETSADIQGSWKWFYADHTPVEYQIQKDYLVYDLLHGGKPIQIHAGKMIEIYGIFKKGGKTYLRPLTSLGEEGMYSFYGIPTDNYITGEPFLENVFTVENKVKYGWNLFLDKTYKTIDGVFRWLKS